MKRKSGKRSWKLLYLEISFSWFKVVFFDETLISKSVPLSLKSLGVSFISGFVLDFGAFSLGYKNDRLLGVRSLLF
ncbi:hypothetical protein [Helicobacter pylori]|uniref:hypothetical protein n=1 Tax=Helicobacter pylori TaxID=210 RepID=UPI0018E9BCC8|nr:hypothetical protein [Helicobacter pylori]